MARMSGLAPQLAQVPMMTLRARDAAPVYAHPGPQLDRLTRRGLLHRVAVGYYVVVPLDRVGTPWIPDLEAAAGGIATAASGAGRAVLMGLSAARLHGVVPRALAVAVVAVPGDRRDVVLRDREARVHFVQRDVDRLDAELVATELGDCLVTTPEQTVLDIAHRPSLGDAEPEARAAVRLLLPRCDAATLERIAQEQRLRAALARVRVGQDGEVSRA